MSIRLPPLALHPHHPLHTLPPRSPDCLFPSPPLRPPSLSSSSSCADHDVVVVVALPLPPRRPSHCPFPRSEAPHAHLTPLLRASQRTCAAFPDRVTETDSVNKVNVKFVLRKECQFGQQFSVVGEDPQFGAWNPQAAIPMEWSEGHVWTAEVDVPIGKHIEFKFILFGKHGEVEWQPGQNRVFETAEAFSSLLVSGSWDLLELNIKASSEKPETMSLLETEIDNMYNAFDIRAAETTVDVISVGSSASTSKEGFRDSRKEYVADGEASDADIDDCSALEPLNSDMASASISVEAAAEGLETDRTIEDSCRNSDNSTPKASLLDKDLDWGRKLLSKLLWGFGGKPQEKKAQD